MQGKRALLDELAQGLEQPGRTDAAEAYRGPLLALVDEVGRARLRSGVNPHGAPR